MAGLASKRGQLEQAIEYYDKALKEDQIPSRDRSTVTSLDNSSNSKSKRVVIWNNKQKAGSLNSKSRTPKNESIKGKHYVLNIRMR